MSLKFFRNSLLVLTLGLASAGAYASWPQLSSVEAAVASQASVPQAQAAPMVAGRAVTQGFADVVAGVTPAVVTIRTEGQASPRMTRLLPVQRGLGSGVIVTADGYILTNHHVIDSAAKISVELSDRRVLDAKLVGSDPPSDLAVIKVDGSSLPVMPIGDSSAMRVGDLVLAVGNPLGVGQTVTMGIVSAKGRATGFGNGGYEDFLQTDAPINQGNSGGALVNTAGELVGINSQILSPSGGNIGIGFAVPSNMAKNVMDQLVVNGRVHRGLLGVTVQGVTGDLAAGLGLDRAEGAIVSGVTPGGAAERAGIKRGDVILGYQGRPVVDTNTFRNEIAATRPGSTVTLKVLRDGRATELEARLGEMTADEGGRRSPDGEREGSGRFGMGLAPLTPEIAAELNLGRDVKGVVISDVDPSGAAASAGLREGDVIQQVNGRSVRTAEDVREGLNAAKDRPAVLLIARGESSFFVPLRGR